MKNKHHTIAIMLGDTQSDYSEDLLRGFYKCATEENVNIVFLMGPQTPQYCKDILSCSMEGDYNYQFDTIYHYAHLVKPDALIIAYGSLSIFNNQTNKEAFLEQFSDIPYLLLEDIPEHCEVPYLIADNYNGMRACMEHLFFDHGYRKIAFLSGPKNNKDASERLQAYKDVLTENGIEITEQMIAYGNYSEQVYGEVNDLLDSNPGLEAIACANDNMAKCCYRVCASRNLMIGTDIAITGFDDVDFSRTTEPPLTSVSHSSFLFSYNALKNAILLCEGKCPTSHRMPVVLHKRASCGCPDDKHQAYTALQPDEILRYLQDAILDISDDLLSGIPYKKDRDFFSNLIFDYFQHIYITVFQHGGQGLHIDYLMGILKHFTSYPHISSALLLVHLSGLLRILISNAPSDKERKLLSSIIAATQQYIHSYDILHLEKEIMASNRKAWFVPSFTRDLVANENDLNAIYSEIMKRLRIMNVKSAYFYFFDEPILHVPNKKLNIPNQIKLAAYYNSSEMVCYEENERPIIATSQGFSEYFYSDHSCCLTSYILFSGAKQYGMLLCEVTQEDISFMQICSLQIGSLLHFIELNSLELKIQHELEDSLKVIQEQNHILSFISEYDELTKILNRRGFMERAIQLLDQHVNEQAYLIFGDLDHLKMINDCYGHAAGDSAIMQSANRLVECLPDKSIIARIGGDEFIALVQSSDPNFKESILASLKENSDAFNARCDKPYYIELSVGIYEFICSSSIDLNEIIKKSDELLYEAKAKRRKDIKKMVIRDISEIAL